MTAILSLTAVLGTAFWFYRTATQRGQPGLAWAVAGVLIYYSAFLFWMQIVLKTLMHGSFQVHDFRTGLGMDLSAILFGVAAMALVRWGLLARKPPH